MTRSVKYALYSAIVLLFAVTSGIASEITHMDAASVTMVKGSVKAYRTGGKIGKPLKKGDLISKDLEIRVAEKARIELRFPDGTVMRLAERSRLRMNEISYNSKTDGKKVNVGLSLGKLWAKVKKLATEDSSVEVKTSNAVAGVRGTVYGVHVEEDASSLVRVYDGSVSVANSPKSESEGRSKAMAPHEVAGPHEVPPPYHEVSREEWTAIVRAMQQIRISPQGIPTKPEVFDADAVADDWVKWNQERDREIIF